eukprot:TRINITY_DN3825_c0_g1_i1.p1 TRINITY_DN3825_c0_g1~~TRINITY_DN3825_c0_g1_i1.p1  ORF type:complete len:129 (+),score=11.02 TRINITY_DN3825_c0_g1_i1:202-588(+)
MYLFYVLELIFLILSYFSAVTATIILCVAISYLIKAYHKHQREEAFEHIIANLHYAGTHHQVPQSQLQDDHEMANLARSLAFVVINSNQCVFTQSTLNFAILICCILNMTLMPLTHTIQMPHISHVEP